jgi:hypothetical protein
MTKGLALLAASDNEDAARDARVSHDDTHPLAPSDAIEPPTPERKVARPRATLLFALGAGVTPAARRAGDYSLSAPPELFSLMLFRQW